MKALADLIFTSDFFYSIFRVATPLLFASMGAVVSDVVDSVRHLNVSTTVMWDEEKLELEDFSKSKKKFFVRSSSSKEDIEKVFGNVEYVDANIDGEFGFITEKISEATFAKKADELGTVISRIRIEG